MRGKRKAACRDEDRKKRWGFPIPFFETCEERCNRGQRYLGAKFLSVYEPQARVTNHLWDAFPPLPILQLLHHSSGGGRIQFQEHLLDPTCPMVEKASRESRRMMTSTETRTDCFLWMMSSMTLSVLTPLSGCSELNFRDELFPASHLQQTQSPHFAVPLPSPLTAHKLPKWSWWVTDTCWQ